MKFIGIKMSKHQTNFASGIALFNLVSAFGIFINKGNMFYAYLNLGCAFGLAVWIALKGQ